MIIKQKNLLIIGPIPEPKGGVSIHITRLKNLLNKDLNINYIDESPIHKPEIFNIRSKNIFTYIKTLLWSDIVHIHSSVTFLRIMHLLVSKILFKKIIVTLHAFRYEKGLHVIFNKLFLKIADDIIVVNNKIPENLKLKNYIVKHAFIPPDLNTEQELPLDIKDWIHNQTEDGNTILAANAFRIDFYNGVDIYGIDLCINAMDTLINKHHLNISLIFTLASHAKSLEVFNRYQSLIRKKGLENHVLLIKHDVSFVKIIEKCDIVLRPTCTDGDALTVREALYLDKSIIASNIIERPPGTILFQNRNDEDLTSKIIDVVENKDRTTSSREPLSTYSDFYLNLYL